MWDGAGAVNGQVVCPWEARAGTFLVGCVGADLAVLQALLLIAAPSSRSALLSALHSCWASCPCPGFLLVSAFHLSLQHFPFVRVLWAQCWRHDSTFGMWGTQTSSSLASFHKCFWMQRNMSSLESTSATRCLESAWNKILVCLSYFYTFPLHPLLLPMRDRLLDWKHLVCSSAADLKLKRPQRELSHKTQFQKCDYPCAKDCAAGELVLFYVTILQTISWLEGSDGTVARLNG